jgi:hypothetical protein
MKTARKTALGTVAASLVVLVAPATVAHADQGDTFHGGCAFDPDEHEGMVTGGQNSGVIFELSVSQEAAGGPSVATVDCWIVVDGIEAAGTRITASGNGVQSKSKLIAFTAGDADSVTLCQQVTFADGSTWADANGANPSCPGEAGYQFPPQFVWDALHAVLGVVNCVVGGQVCTPIGIEGTGVR